MSAESFPVGLKPMLASAGPLPQGEKWVFELKWDGVRALVGHTKAGGLRIWTRNGNVVTDTYPELASLVPVLEDHDMLLDGEIVAFDETGLPSFRRIQERLGVNARDAIIRSRSNPVVFVVFDLLHLDGMSTRSLHWEQRRALLEQLDIDNGLHWRLSTVNRDGESLLAATREADLEGVIAKRTDSPYSPATRAISWVKIKNNTIDEFVIGGWVPGEGRRESMIGALLLGTPESDEPDAPLKWIGKAGTGFNMAELDRLYKLLEPDKVAKRPFVNDPVEPTAVYVQPKHKCYVEFREWTAEGIMRFPSYKGLVADRETSMAADLLDE